MKSRHSKCGCGADIAQKVGPGRPRMKCDPCANPPPKPRPISIPKAGYIKLGLQETFGTCDHCRSDFTYLRGRGRKRRFCSANCRSAFYEGAGGTKPCAYCGEIFLSRAGLPPECGLFCSRACRGLSQRRPEQVAENARKSASRRRARKRGATIEDFTHLEVFERDRWKCGLCGKRVDRKLAYPDPMSASLDHIVPLCEGGEHSLRNVQCSHWICNSRKTFGPGGQMRLFG